MANIPRNPTPTSSGHNPVHSLWDQLRQTEPTNHSDYSHLFRSILYHKDYAEFTGGLQSAESLAFIDTIDKALDTLPVNTDLWNKGLRALRKLCATTRQLPSSCMLSDGLEKSGDIAVQSGTFADIWQGFYGDVPVAIKSLRVYNSNDLQVVLKTLCKEAVVWKRLEHPSLLPFLGVSTTLFRLCVVLPWMSAGSVGMYIKDHPEANRLELIYQIGQGLEFLHTRHIVHGNLKGHNILVDDSGHARIADFGLTSITVDPLSINASTGGAKHNSSRWMSPELLDPNHSSATDRPTMPCDVYAFAMSALEIFSGDIPYSQHRNQKIIFMVIEGTRPKRPSNSAEVGLSDEIWAIMQACWEREPTKRPKIGEVVKVFAKALNIPDLQEDTPDPASLTPLNDGEELLLKSGGGLPTLPSSKHHAPNLSTSTSQRPSTRESRKSRHTSEVSGARDRTAVQYTQHASQPKGGCCIIQ